MTLLLQPPEITGVTSAVSNVFSVGDGTQGFLHIRHALYQLSTLVLLIETAPLASGYRVG